MVVRKRESSCTVGGNVNLIKPLWWTVWGFHKTLKIRLPYDPAILLLYIYPKETITQKDTSTPMFTETLLKLARIWKQPRCPLMAILSSVSVNVRVLVSFWVIVSLGYICRSKIAGLYGNLIFSVWRNPHTVYIYTHTHIWNLEKRYRWTYLQDRTRDAEVENGLWTQKREREGGMNGEGNIDIYTPPCVK